MPAEPTPNQSIFLRYEIFRCPHCRALYEIRYDEGVTDDNRLAHCQVCGKQMDARNGSSICYYEPVNMPDGTRSSNGAAAQSALGGGLGTTPRSSWALATWACYMPRRSAAISPSR